MKRLALILSLALGICSCNNGPSKPYQMLEEESQAIEAKIGETTNCDDLQMLHFGILGLRSDFDNLKLIEEVKESEIEQMREILDQLDATWEKRWNSLGCEQPDSDDELDTSGEEDGTVF